jgi:RNA polymerase sigma-70 factor (ECF subfamily)
MSLRKYSNEEEMADAWNAGEEGIFSKIYDAYWNQLLAAAYKLTRDKELAEEIVQEVFLSLWRRRHNLHIQSLSHYLATAVKFATFKMLQRTKRHQELQGQEFPNPQIHLEEELIDVKFLQEYLNGVVEHLPEKCKLVFRMSREDLNSNKEISGELAISEKTVEAHITKALKILKLSLRKVGFVFFIFLFA